MAEREIAESRGDLLVRDLGVFSFRRGSLGGAKVEPTEGLEERDEQRGGPDLRRWRHGFCR